MVPAIVPSAGPRAPAACTALARSLGCAVESVPAPGAALPEPTGAVAATTRQVLEVNTNLDVVLADMPDGGVLFDLNSKQYYSLNQTGVLAWRHLESGGDLASLEATLSESALRHQAMSNGDGTSTGDGACEPTAADPLGLWPFLDRLAAAGLLSGDPFGAGEHFPVDGRRRAGAPPAGWPPPTLEPHGSPLSEVILSPFDPTTPIPE